MYPIIHSMILNSFKNNKKLLATSVAGVIVVAILSGTAYASSASRNAEKKTTTINRTETSISPTITTTPTPTMAKSDDDSDSKSTPNTPTPTQITSNENKPALTSTPAPTTAPTQTAPTPTPTPQTGTTIKGRYVDGNGNSISFTDIKVKISNPDKGISQESSSTPNFEFSGLPAGNYLVEAQPKDGYSIMHDLCFNCEFEDHYHNSASFVVGITESHKTIGVTFKYSAQ